MTARYQKSSGNVFADLGFATEEAENLRVRSEMMARITRMIRERRITQTRAAKLFGVTQPRISDLMRGKIDLFSVDSLIAMLGHAGMRVNITVSEAA